MRRSDALRDDGEIHVVTVTHDGRTYDMANVEIQRNGVVTVVDLKDLLRGMRRNEAYYRHVSIPMYPSDDELRSMNFIARRNDTNEVFLSQKSA